MLLVSPAFIATLRRVGASERTIKIIQGREYTPPCLHRSWYTSDPPVCAECGLVGNTE